MAIVRFTTYLEVYRHRAGGADPHTLSGRPGRQDLTQFISRRILEMLSLKPGETLVDIGCGDGDLLRRAAAVVGEGWGVLPSSEEVQRVEPGFIGGPIRIRQGMADATGLPDNLADKLVSNGVFILLAREQVDAALLEMARVGKPGALVFIGEVPVRDELAGRGYGDSIPRWLLWVLRKRGVRAFLANVGQTLRARFGDELMVITPKNHYYEEPSVFKARAEHAGLRPLRSDAHREIDPTGVERESPTRMDYLFRLEKAA